MRRIVSLSCLKPHVTAYYDADRDNDYLEHFELIKSGTFAGQYYTPWSNFVEAFACDRGKTVYFEAKVMSFDGRETICTSFFNVGEQNPNQAKIELGKITTPLNRQVRVPLSITPFFNVAGLQLAVKFDATLLRLDSVHVPHASLERMGFGYPGQGNNPRDRVALAWSFDGRTPVTLPNQTPLIELCFTPLKTGSSKIWIDTLGFTTELIDVNTVEFVTRTRSGEVQVLTQSEIAGQQAQTLRAPSLTLDESPDKLRPDIRIFPNPGSDRVNVALPANWKPSGWIVLKDLQGRVLLKQIIKETITSLDTQAFPAGLFFVELHQEKQTWVERLVLFKR